MHCTQNKHLYKSSEVKKMIDEIIKKMPPHYGPFMKLGLEDLFSKFATGKDFSDSDKETLYAYAKKINLSEYINIELLEVLLKNNSPYVCKDGDKYLFDADVIIENQKNSKTLLDQDYVDRLLQENSQLGDINKHRLSMIKYRLSQASIDQQLSVFQDDLKIENNNLYIKQVCLPEKLSSSFNDHKNGFIHCHTEQINDIFDFFVRLMNIYKTSNKTLILPVTYSNKLTSLTIIRQEVLQYLQDMIEIYKQKESQEEGKSLIEVSFGEEFIDSLIDKTKDSKQYIDYIKEEPLSLSLKDGNVKSERNIIDYIDREYEQTFKQLNGLLNDDEHYKFPQKDMNNFNIPSLYENKSLLSFIDVISIFIGHGATQLPYMPYRNNELLCLGLGLYGGFKLKDYNPSDTSSKTHFREYYQIGLKNEEIT